MGGQRAISHGIRTFEFVAKNLENITAGLVRRTSRKSEKERGDNRDWAIDYWLEFPTCSDKAMLSGTAI